MKRHKVGDYILTAAMNQTITAASALLALTSWVGSQAKPSFG